MLIVLCAIFFVVACILGAGWADEAIRHRQTRERLARFCRGIGPEVER